MVQLAGIDKADDRPPYRQIAAALREAINLGRLSSGDRLPSESELVKRYGVARMTVRQAIQELKTEGLVVSEHGRGVRIKVEEVPATGAVAERLGLKPGDPVVVRDRRYLANGEPVETAISYIPADLARGTAIVEHDTGPGGLYARLEENGHILDHFVEEVAARMPTHDERRALTLGPGVPVLTVIRTAYDTTAACARCSRSARSPRMTASVPDAFCAAGTAPRAT